MERLSIHNLWLSFQSTVNTFQGGFYRPKKDFQQKVNDISDELFNVYTRGAERSQEYRDNLFFLLKSKNIKCEPGRGNYTVAKPPDGYARFSGLSCITISEQKEEKCEDERIDYDIFGRTPIDLIDNMRWPSVVGHITKRPTIKNPKATFQDESFIISPREIINVVLDYYVKPSQSVFAYTLTPGNKTTGEGQEIVYDKEKSKDLDWPSTLKNEFIVRLGESYGLFTRDQFMTSFNFQKKNNL